VAVRRISRDEYTPDPILVGHGDPQVPKPDVLEFGFELEPGGPIEERLEVETVRCSIRRDWSVEEPCLSNHDSPKEHPVSLQIRVEHAVGRAFRESPESLVQLFRPEDGQHHLLVEV
jgi:hypothetical protein